MIDKNIFKDILLYKKHLILMLISNIIQAFLLSVASYTIAYLANKLLFEQFYLDYATATPLLGLLFFFLSMRSILKYYNDLTAKKLSLKLQSNLRQKLLKVLAYNPHLQNKSEGDWLSLITKGVDKLDSYITGFLPQFAILITLPPILLIVSFVSDWISGMIFLVTAPLIPFFMMMIGKLADKENKRQWQLFQKLTNYMSDLLPGLLVLKVYNQIENQLQTATDNGNKFSEATLKVLRIAFLSAFMLEFIATLSIAIIAVNIGLRLLSGEAMFLPTFFMLLIAPQFYQPFRQFGSAFHDAMNGITASNEIYFAINSFNSDNNLGNKIKLSNPPELEFKQVNFAYENNAPLWHNLNFTILKGKQNVLIGQNGMGKSTLLKLLLKSLKLIEGNIYIDNKNLSALNTISWHKELGYATQEPYIFTATIRENITLGRNVSFADILSATDKANLTQFINDLPQGFDTVIGNNIKLSFGQKRRLGLARALLTNPKLLLLDEPMENLDSNNERLVQNLLNDLKTKTTILIIAHREQTIKQADHIILLENGNSYEFDTFKEYMDFKGIYNHE